MPSRECVIRCPNCTQVQPASVFLPEPMAPFPDWAMYVHICEACGHTILESEWDEVRPTQSDEDTVIDTDTPHVVTEDDGDPD